MSRFLEFLTGILGHIVRINGILSKMFDVILNGNSTYTLCMLSKGKLSGCLVFLIWNAGMYLAVVLYAYEEMPP